MKILLIFFGIILHASSKPFSYESKRISENIEFDKENVDFDEKIADYENQKLFESLISAFLDESFQTSEELQPQENFQDVKEIQESLKFAVDFQKVRDGYLQRSKRNSGEKDYFNYWLNSTVPFEVDSSFIGEFHPF